MGGAGVLPALIVVVLWASGVLRSLPSVLFLLACCACLTYVARLGVRAVSGAPDGFVAVTRIVVLVTTAALPVYFDNRTFDIFNLPKLTLLMAADVVVAAALIGRWWAGTRPSLTGGLWIPALALLGWTGIATLTGQEPVVSVLGSTGSYEGLVAAASFTFLLLAVSQTFDRESSLLVLKALYFGATPLVVLYGLFQLHDLVRGGRWDWAAAKGTFPFKNASIWSTLGNPDHLGAFLAICLPIGLVLVLSTRHRATRVMIGLISLGGLAELVETQARGSWIALPLALLAALGALWPRIRREPAALRLVRWGAGAAGVLVAVLLASGHLRHRITSAFELKAVGSSGERVQIWHTVLRISGHHVLTGIGPDVLPDVYPRYQTAHFLAQFGRERVNGAHNILLDYLSGTGVVGLVLFLAVVGLAAREWLGSRGEVTRDDADAAAGVWSPGLVTLACLASGVVAYLVQAMFNVQQIGLAFLFWLFLGLVAAGAGPAEPAVVSDRTERRRAPPGPRGRRPVGPSRSARSGGGATLAAVLALVGLWACTRPYRGDVAYASALTGETALSATPAPPPGRRYELEQGATADIRSAIALDGWNADYALQYARGVVTTLVSDRPGTAQQALDEQIADRAFRRVISLQPVNAGALSAYGQFLLGVHELNPALDPSSLQNAIRYLSLAAANDPTNTQIGGLLARARRLH